MSRPEPTKEDVFEKLPAKDKQAVIRAHQDDTVWYGNCTRCGHRIEGKLRDIRGRPCPGCGYGPEARRGG